MSWLIQKNKDSGNVDILEFITQIMLLLFFFWCMHKSNVWKDIHAQLSPKEGFNKYTA